jgi:hypothetical protein
LMNDKKNQYLNNLNFFFNKNVSNTETE